MGEKQSFIDFRPDWSRTFSSLSHACGHLNLPLGYGFHQKGEDVYLLLPYVDKGCYVHLWNNKTIEEVKVQFKKVLEFT